MNLREARNVKQRLLVRRGVLRRRLRAAEHRLYGLQAVGHSTRRDEQKVDRCREALIPFENAYRNVKQAITLVEESTYVFVDHEAIHLSKKQVE
jgi:hypothetical protein